MSSEIDERELGLRFAAYDIGARSWWRRVPRQIRTYTNGGSGRGPMMEPDGWRWTKAAPTLPLDFKALEREGLPSRRVRGRRGT